MRPLTPGGIGATLPPMATLTLDEVKDIGTAAIRRVIGDTFTDAEVGITFGADDSAYYLFTLRFPTEALWRLAVPLSSKLSLAVSDELWAKGDPMIAFALLESDGTWNLTRHAAAE